MTWCLSEEGVDNPARLTAERVWIVDPLDGTREFSELGRDDWAVHVALWQAGRAGRRRGGAAGAGHHAGDADRRAAAAGAGASRGSWCRAPGPPRWPCRSATHWTATLVEMGSAGAKVASVVQGLVRRLRARRRSVRVGLRGTGRGGPCRRPVHVAHRRFAADLQPDRSQAARSDRVPPRIDADAVLRVTTRGNLVR